MFAVGMAMTPEMGQMMQGFADRAAASLAPYEAGHYSNFTEESGGAGRFFGGRTLGSPARGQGQVRPGEPVPREPSDPAGRGRHLRVAA